MFLVIGSITVDLIVTGMAHLPTPGGDEFSHDNLAFTQRPLRMVVGGNGANSAYVLGRLGAPVEIAGAVGNDELGRCMETWLLDAGVESRRLLCFDHAATSTTVIVQDDALNRASFHHAGAYAAFGAEHMDAGWLTGVETLLLTSFPLLTGLRPHYAAILHAAHGAGVTTMVDIGPAIGAVASMDELSPLLPDIDYVVANEHELAACCAGATQGAALEALVAAGARAVIRKMGAAGAQMRTAEGAVHAPGLPVAVHATVGAGDAFNAGFAWGLAQGMDPATALRAGNAVAGLVVASPQGILTSPTAGQVMAHMDG